MAVQVLSASEIKQVSGGEWTGLDWLAFIATGGVAATTGGFGAAAWAAGGAVEALGELPGPSEWECYYYPTGDQDTFDWETSGYYD